MEGGRVETSLLLLPAALAMLVLAAHFLRAAQPAGVLVCLAGIGLLFVRRRWAARAIQVLLVLGTIEWLRTLAVLAAARRAAGEPWMRMAAILSAVALVSAASLLAFRAARVRRRFGLATTAND